MEGSLQDYQTQFHTGKVMGANAMMTLNPGPGMRVLDLGCGDGYLTQQISESGAEVVGVDLDAEFVAAAQERGLRALVQDGHHLDKAFSKEEFDRVFSNATLHWLSEDPMAVLRGIFQILRPGGVFVAEFGGHGNVHNIVSALKAELRNCGVENPEKRNPWFFPTSKEYEGMLSTAGFKVQQCEIVDFPTLMGENLEIGGWLRTFSGKWLRGLDDTAVKQILEGTSKSLAATNLREDGRWLLDYVRIRVVAEKPSE